MNVQVYFQLHSGQKSEPTIKFLAISVRPERSKCDTLKAQNHLLDVTNVVKPWGRVQVYFQLHSRKKCEPTVKFLAIQPHISG